MKRFLIVGVLALSIMSFVAVFAETLDEPGEVGKLISFNCTVEEVRYLAPTWGTVWGAFRGRSYEVKLKVNTDTDSRIVYLCPAGYLEQQNIKIGRYDFLAVKGFQKTFDGKPAIIAQEIKKGDTVLKLRDQKGVPLWTDAQAKKESD